MGLMQSLLPHLGSEGVMGYKTFSSFGQQSLRTSCGKNLSGQIPAEILASGEPRSLCRSYWSPWPWHSYAGYRHEEAEMGRAAPSLAIDKGCLDFSPGSPAS